MRRKKLRKKKVVKRLRRKNFKKEANTDRGRLTAFVGQTEPLVTLAPAAHALPACNWFSD